MATHIDWNDVALDELLHSVHGPVGEDLERRAIEVENTQKRLLSMHGSGVIYGQGSTTYSYTRKSGKVVTATRHKVHQASAPGEPPATDTGRLRATVGHGVGHDQLGLYINVGSGGNPAIPGVAYATYLEYGTRNIAPRPWLRPSVKAAEGEHHT